MPTKSPQLAKSAKRLAEIKEQLLFLADMVSYLTAPLGVGLGEEAKLKVTALRDSLQAEREDLFLNFKP